MSKQRQPTGLSRQHNYQQQEHHHYHNEEQKDHTRRDVRGLSEQQQKFIYTIIPSIIHNNTHYYLLKIIQKF